MLLLLARYTLSRSPRTVVEFGSGVSTLVTAECLRRKGGGSIITHDHHSSFAAETAQRLRALGLEADVRSVPLCPLIAARSEEHTSELQSLMRISYAVFCLKKKNTEKIHNIATAL